MAESYSWSQILQNAVAENTEFMMLTPGVVSPENYKFDEAAVVHNGQVLQRSQFTLSWHNVYSYAMLRNLSGRRWAPQDLVSLAVQGRYSSDPRDLAVRIAALEATSADHESRIAALEAAGKSTPERH